MQTNNYHYLQKPLKKKLKKYLTKTLDLSIQEYIDILDFIVERSIDDAQNTFGGAPMKDRILIDYIQNIQISYMRRILNEDVKYAEISRSLDHQYGIILVGAGVSFESGLPLTRHLAPIVWESLKQIDDSVDWKVLCGDNILDEHWEKIANNEKAYEHFVQSFIHLANRPDLQPSEAHKIICEFFQNNIFLEIICFNWDCLIEKTYRKLTGLNIEKVVSDSKESKLHNLWKMNGDVENPKFPFVLPYGPGGPIFKSLISCLQNYDGAPFQFVLVVLGYSEREQTITEGLINVFQKNRKKYSIRPDLNLDAPDDVIIGTASYAMRKIKQNMKNREKRPFPIKT